MTQTYNGPFINIYFRASETTNRNVTLELPPGYSYTQITINMLNNISELVPGMYIHTGDNITFPVVNSKSPSILPLTITDPTKQALSNLPLINLVKYQTSIILIKLLIQF